MIKQNSYGHKAYGVHIGFHDKGITRDIRARKEVIVSGGALNSPHILLLSGVGAREQLEQFDVGYSYSIL